MRFLYLIGLMLVLVLTACGGDDTPAQNTVEATVEDAVGVEEIGSTQTGVSMQVTGAVEVTVPPGVASYVQVGDYYRLSVSHLNQDVLLDLYIIATLPPALYRDEVELCPDDIETFTDDACVNITFEDAEVESLTTSALTIEALGEVLEGSLAMNFNVVSVEDEDAGLSVNVTFTNTLLMEATPEP